MNAVSLPFALVVGPNASNLSVGDPITLLCESAMAPGHVTLTYTSGEICVECGLERNRARYLTHARYEGTQWARGIGPDVSAALLLTGSAC